MFKVTRTGNVVVSSWIYSFTDSLISS